MLSAQGIVLNRRNHREPRHLAHGHPVVLFQLDEHENGLRQMTRFLMVSSNWDDSFGIQHLPSTIYALAETAWGENAVCSHTILSSQSGLSGSSRLIALTRAPLEPYGRAVRCGHRKFMLTNHNIYNYVRAKYFV